MRISGLVTHVFLAFILQVPIVLYGQVTFEMFDEYTIGPSPQALKAADFNNDGWMDIVSANLTVTTTKHVSLMMNNKVGGFNLTNLTVVKGYIDLELADFDKNGNMDFVAASNTDDKITIFLGNGNGTFASASFDAGDGPLDVLTGDFNEDTHSDIAVLHQSSDDLYIFYGDGLGGVGTPQIISLNAQASQMTVGDFNGNNHLDIVVGANTLLYFYGGDGAGNFAAAAPTGSGFSGFDYLGADDIDNDGDLDLVAAGSSFGFTSIGAGDGTFGPIAYIPEGGRISLSADFDEDGNVDIVSTKKGKLIYYPGDGTGIYNNLPYHRISIGALGMETADFNNDGKLDIATSSTFSSLAGKLFVLYGKGSGYFESQFEYPAPNNPRGLTGGDFNEDGEVDLALVADGKLVIFLGEVDGSFTKISTQTAGSFLYDIEAIHINADNHVDLAAVDVTANTINLFTGDGTGVFSSAGSINVTADFELFVSDVNNDLIDDLVLGGGQAKNVQIFKGNGDNTFSFLFEADMGETVKSVTVDLINNDLNPDLAVLINPATGPSKIKFFQGDGLGGFTPVVTDLSLPKGGQTLSKGDFNNDGKIDFLSLASDGDIFVGNGDFTFTYSSTNEGVFLVEHSTEVKDIDGDGFGDLITGSDCSICSSGGIIQVNRGIGDGTFSGAFWSQNAIGGYRPFVADFNNDGKNDIASLINNTDFDGLSILLNTSGPPPCDSPNITVNPVSTSLCAGSANYVLFVNATGTAPLTYQWQKDGINIPGALNSASYTLSNYTQAEAGVYRCIVTNNCGNDTSAGATVVIYDTPGDPTTSDAGECGAASVTLVASGGTDGNYRWYDVASGGVALAGEVNSNFTTPVLTATKAYYVSVSNGSCESNRVMATALITHPIVITAQPSHQNSGLGDDVTFTVSVTGDNPAYQWKKDGVNLVGENLATLTITNVAESDQGSYTCSVFNDCNSVTTDPADLSVIVTGLEHSSIISAWIYPNPSKGMFLIQNRLEGNFRILVHSLQGKEVYSQNLDSSMTTIDLSHLTNGLYVVTLTNDNAAERIKIMIDR